MPYMDEWEYHKMLEMQENVKSALVADETALKEVIREIVLVSIPGIKIISRLISERFYEPPYVQRTNQQHDGSLHQ